MKSKKTRCPRSLLPKLIDFCDQLKLLYNITNKNLMIPLEVEEPVSKKAPEWFQHWSDNVFIPFKNNVEKDIAELKQDVKVLKQDVKVLKQDVALIKSCPTIARELKEIQTNKTA